jgi:hypothetical protein
MNKIVNDFGALRHDTYAAIEAQKALLEYEDAIRNIINNNELNPIEIRCLAACLTPTVFAEEVLRKATKKMKADRQYISDLTRTVAELKKYWFEKVTGDFNLFAWMEKNHNFTYKQALLHGVIKKD